MKTSSEVATLVGIKRQRIQEYEKAGIALKPKIKNNRGYWMYGEAEIERLWQIKFYQELKLEVPEIKAIFSNPNYNKHDEIENLIAGLEQKKKELESMIEIARAYNEMDILPSDLCGKNNKLEDIPYEAVVPLLGKFLSLFFSESSAEFWKSLIVDFASEADGEQWARTIENIAGFYTRGVPYNDDSVQQQVETLRQLDKNVVPDSWFKQLGHCRILIGEIYEDDIKEAFGEKCYNFIKEAVDYYDASYKIKSLESTPDIFLEIPAVKVFLNIECLAQNRYTTGSDEVLSEIRKLHELVSNIGAFSEVAQLELLNSIASSIGCESSIKIFDGNRKHGVWWFTSKAIQIYCKHQQETMTKEGESNE